MRTYKYCRRRVTSVPLEKIAQPQLPAAAATKSCHQLLLQRVVLPQKQHAGSTYSKLLHHNHHNVAKHLLHQIEEPRHSNLSIQRPEFTPSLQQHYCHHHHLASVAAAILQ